MTTVRTSSAPPVPLGVIETLTAGFQVVGRNPWLLLFPLLLDLFLWLGPPLLMGPPVVSALVAPLAPSERNSATLPPEMAEQLATTHETLTQVLSGANLWGAGVPFLFWPTAVVGQPSAPPDGMERAAQGWQLDSVSAVGGAALGLAALGLALNLFWLNAVAASVRRQRMAELWRLLPKRMAGQLLWLLLLLLLALFGLLGALVPLFLVAALLALVPGVGSLLATVPLLAFLWAATWLYFYFYFTVAALIVTDQGLRAPLVSLTLVRRFGLSALGFVLLSMILSQGFGIIWGGLNGSPFGTGISVVGSSVLGTALTAAMMIFFAQRLRLMLHEARAARAASESRASAMIDDKRL